MRYQIEDRFYNSHWDLFYILMIFNKRFFSPLLHICIKFIQNKSPHCKIVGKKIDVVGLKEEIKILIIIKAPPILYAAFHSFHTWEFNDKETLRKFRKRICLADTGDDEIQDQNIFIPLYIMVKM
ncbi:hypothetical protein IQ37_10195 [Chryseobacterium piperi]|uniref:Uncharacterized protein n=1 Tax=Chryseobacterium piperi TaxID=558152 RepID=A0A086BF69_9FLAO|nr:hypothetical protein CJF12_14305 [Chryseobacterium piperi]KFF27583.1 hypothetical protein IQ37_10195 [Chryseobacterium piperi]